MSVRDDQRGQSVQVGAVLLLAILVLAAASYQATVVPNQNRQVEYNHNQEVRGQMLEVRNGVVSIPGGGSGSSVSLQLGTTYPERTIFLNPGPASGQVRTTPAVNASVENATASGETGDFWNGDRLNYSTRALVYRPDYNVYPQEPDIVYENTVLYNRFPNQGETVVDADQTLIRDRRITVVALAGEFQEASSGSRSVDLTALSTSTTRVAVSDDGSPVTIRVPTRLSNDTWADLLEPQYDENDGYVVGHEVEAVSGSEFDVLVIELQQGVTYDLRMARVGVGNRATAPGPAYLTAVEGDGETIQPGENLTLVTEVRDRFNNPVSGTAVNASIVSGPGGGSVTPQDVSDSAGRSQFLFNGSNNGTYVIEATFSNSPNDARTVRFRVTVQALAGGGGGGGGGGSGPPVFSSTPNVNDTTSGNKAGYSVSYSVDDPSGNFSFVEVVFDCTTCTGASGDETNTSTSTDDTITYTGTGNSDGESYDITIRVYDDSGTVTAECIAGSDSADGTDPSVSC